MKVISVRDLVQKGASGVIANSESEPVLITRNGEPAAWLIGSKWLADAGTDQAELYREALVSLAIALFDQEALSLGQAAKLAGMVLEEFITTAGHRGVPVLRSPPGGLGPQIEALERALAAGEAKRAQSGIPLSKVEVQALSGEDGADADLLVTPEDRPVPA